MSVTARYLMINQDELTALLDSGVDLLDDVRTLERDPAHEVLDLGSLWDALHFVITGVSASTPLDDDPISDAIVGVQLFFEDDDADFIAFTPAPDLPALIAGLKAVDVPARGRAFTPTAAERVEAYPDGIFDGDREDLVSRLFTAVESLIDFYERAAASGRHVIVSIV
ncbi:YfbM family protein [Nakamurella deserti]|uniref:YfbM family protein n=1 Tax=Nakamurella deserti TaxID=2164074 RepID=UPI000DBE656E|nr:YfbM family protein [Nakamurella deserti]